MLESKKRGIFLDADGVLWPDQGPGGILKSRETAFQTLIDLKVDLANTSPYSICVITNQTLAARGEMPYRKFRNYVGNFFGELKESKLIDSYEVCYHHPHAKKLLLRKRNCNCRKPKPGMILKQMNRLQLDSSQSILVGDRITDIAAGVNAGITSNFLIHTNRALEVNLSHFGHSYLPKSIEFRLIKNLKELSEHLNSVTK